MEWTVPSHEGLMIGQNGSLTTCMSKEGSP